MSYDCIIIGGGISGLVCGIKCASEGLRCMIFSAGMSALHFSSGSIDVLGYDPDGNRIQAPLEELERFIPGHTGHPYARCGRACVEEALTFFRSEVEKEAFFLYANGNENHFHVTTLGTLKPTFLSQKSVFNERLRETVARSPRIAILTVEGFKDFYPDLAAENLGKHPLFHDARIITGSVDLSGLYRDGDNPYDFRSVDIARLFDRPGNLEPIARRINEAAGDAEIVGLPAFIGIRNTNTVMEGLQTRLQGFLYEIPTLPPSILGMRLDDALKSRFAALGGVFIAGDRVTGGEIRNGTLDHIHTRNHGDSGLRARCFVLSTGSFFSGGLTSDVHSMREPVFGLPVEQTPGRASWQAPTFFHPDSHPFLEFGVNTNGDLNPEDASGQVVENLYCAGAVLSGYNPVREGSGGGVAISTGYHAAKQILAHCGKETHDRPG